MMHRQTESASWDACVQKSIMSQSLSMLEPESNDHSPSLGQFDKSVHFLIAVEEVCSRLAFELQCDRAGLTKVETSETFTDFIRAIDDFQTSDEGVKNLVVILGQGSWLSLMRGFVFCKRPFHVIDASMEGMGEDCVKLLASCNGLEFSEAVRECLDSAIASSQLVFASRASTSASEASEPSCRCRVSGETSQGSALLLGCC